MCRRCRSSIRRGCWPELRSRSQSANGRCPSGTVDLLRSAWPPNDRFRDGSRGVAKRARPPSRSCSETWPSCHSRRLTAGLNAKFMEMSDGWYSLRTGRGVQSCVLRRHCGARIRPGSMPISRIIGARVMPSFAASSAATKSMKSPAALDQLYAEGAAHGRCFRHGNLFYNVAREGDGSEPLVRMVQWPSYHQPVLNGVRLDTRFVDLLEPLIGRNLKQIINQVHWKAPGSLGDFAWHQDSRSRRPPEAYRNLATSYVQTGLAIDPHTRSRAACVSFRAAICAAISAWIARRRRLGTPMTDDALGRGRAFGADAVDLLLEPGDLALWSPYLVHGSGKNTLRAQAPALHQRLCPRRGLRPRRMGVPRRVPGAVRSEARAGPLRSHSTSGRNRIMSTGSE